MQHGSTYYFTNKDDFERGIHDGKFLEQAVINGHYFGTSRKAVESVIASGKVRAWKPQLLAGADLWLAGAWHGPDRSRHNHQPTNSKHTLLERLSSTTADMTGSCQ